MSRSQSFWTFLVLGLMVVSINLVFGNLYIERQLPYVGFVDEPALAKRAGHIARSGDLNPHFFNYPSLPFYLVAGTLKSTYQITDSPLGNVGYPYYQYPDLIRVPKTVFHLMALSCMVLAGWVAYRYFTTSPVVLFLVPAILSHSGVFFFYSAQYLNVDIVGCFWVFVALFLTARIEPGGSMVRNALLPGLAVGLAASSKYGLGVVLAAPILALVLAPEKRRIHIVLIPVAAAIGFFGTSPYTILDFPSFWEDFTFESRHYRRGHAGFDGDPGLPQLWYYLKSQLMDFGAWTLPLAILGQIRLWKGNWRKALVFHSFPLLLLALLSSYRVHFVRNALSIHVFYSLSLAVGFWTLGCWLTGRVRGLPIGRRKGVSTIVTVVGLGLVFFLTMPVERPWRMWTVGPDTRNEAERWLLENAQGETILIPKELAMDTRNLSEVMEVLECSILKNDVSEYLEVVAQEKPSLVVLPHFHHDTRKPNGEEIAARYNSLVDEFQVIQEFTNPRSMKFISSNEPTTMSGKGVLVNYSVPVPDLNPGFYLARTEHSANRHSNRIVPPPEPASRIIAFDKSTTSHPLKAPKAR